MFSFLSVGLIALAGIGMVQGDSGCGVPTDQTSTAVSPSTISSCTLFYTPSIPPQIGPTSTVYATVMTTEFNVVNCKYCQISIVPDNPMPTGPFTTKITLDYLLRTQIGCIPSTSLFPRRQGLPEATPEPTALYIRGADPQGFTPMVKPRGVSVVNHLKRQTPAGATGTPLVLEGEASRLIEQLFTVLYSVGVINSGGNLGDTCAQLQSANAILDLAKIGINATQASAIVCAASGSDSVLSSFNQSLIASAAAGLYGVQLAANFTGTADTDRLCSQLDLSSLPALGVDVVAVQDFICRAQNSTSTTMSSAPTSVPSIGTLTTLPWTNSSGGSLTWAGSNTVTGPASAPRGTAAQFSGTGFNPTGNRTGEGGSAPTGSAFSGSGSLPAETGPFGNRTTFGSSIVGSGRPPTSTSLSAGTGTVGNTTAARPISAGSGSLPASTGPFGNRTTFGPTIGPTGGLPTGTGTVGNGTGSGPTTVGSTGVSAGTGSAGNRNTTRSTISKTGNRPEGTGTAGNRNGSCESDHDDTADDGFDNDADASETDSDSDDNYTASASSGDYGAEASSAEEESAAAETSSEYGRMGVRQRRFRAKERTWEWEWASRATWADCNAEVLSPVLGNISF